MTAQNTPTAEDKKMQLLEEICENTRAIRRVANRILDHLHEYHASAYDVEEGEDSYHDSDELSLDDMDNSDDIYL